MSDTFRNALSTPEGRRMLLELIAYSSRLPETLMLGAQHLIGYMQTKASEEERAKGRAPVKPALGVKRG